MKQLVTLVVLVALLATACTTSDNTETTVADGSTTTTSQSVMLPIQGELARADVARVMATDATSAELMALVAGDAEFAFDLFRVAAANGENTLLSPYSVAAALTMTYAGASGDTASEMAGVLHFGVEGDRVHTLRNELDLRITTGDLPTAPDDDREPFSIQIANSLWGQAGFPFLADFLVVLAENYDAGMNLVDFVSAAEEARNTINSWVEEQTNDRIVNLLPEGVVDSLTRLVLVNAIWFKASWAEQFNADNTIDGPFTTLDAVERTVPLMHGGGRLQYGVGDGYQLVRLPYAGDAAMVIVLPNAGRFDEIVDILDPQFLADASNAATTVEVNLTMPRFEFESEFSLSKTLQNLGMVEAFSGAGFTEIVDQRGLLIQDVVHQAFIAVDEEGTEAAAATAVIIGFTSAGPPPITMTVDRPFVFIIEHASTGEILFLGQVIDPSLN